MICRTCSTDKPLTEYSVDKRNGLPLRHCKECHCAKARVRYATEEYKEWSRTRRARDPAYAEQARESLRAWRKNNEARYRANYVAHNARTYAADPQKHIARSMANRDPDKHCSHMHRRRMQMLGVDSPGVTADEWRAIKAKHGNRCYYCSDSRRKLTRDHVVPVSRGGKDEPGNIVPSCQSCNSSKGSKLLLEWPKYAYRGPQFKDYEEFNPCRFMSATLSV